MADDQAMIEIVDNRTDTERRRDQAQELRRRAKEAQDMLGWANPLDLHTVTHATVDLARVVTDLAGLVHQTLMDLAIRDLRAALAGKD